MSGRKRHQRRIRQIILAVNDFEEVFELNNNEEFKLKKDVIIQKTHKMLKKIKECEQKKQKIQVNILPKLTTKEEKCELKTDLFHDLFNNNLQDEIDFFDIEIQEKGEMMNAFDKSNNIF